MVSARPTLLKRKSQKVSKFLFPDKKPLTFLVNLLQNNNPENSGFFNDLYYES